MKLTTKIIDGENTLTDAEGLPADFTIPSEITCMDELAFQRSKDLCILRLHEGIKEFSHKALAWNPKVREVHVPYEVAKRMPEYHLTYVSRSTIPIGSLRKEARIIVEGVSEDVARRLPSLAPFEPIGEKGLKRGPYCPPIGRF